MSCFKTSARLDNRLLNSARCGTHPLNCETSEYVNFTANSNVSGKVGRDARKRRGLKKGCKVGEIQGGRNGKVER